jgi:hypothetical protein
MLSVLHPVSSLLLLKRPSAVAGVVMPHLHGYVLFLYADTDAGTIVLTYNQILSDTPVMTGLVSTHRALTDWRPP